MDTTPAQWFFSALMGGLHIFPIPMYTKVQSLTSGLFLHSLLFHVPQPGLTHKLLRHPLSPKSQVSILISQHRDLAAHSASCPRSALSDSCYPILLCHLLTSSPSFSFQPTFQPPSYLPDRVYSPLCLFLISKFSS